MNPKIILTVVIVVAVLFIIVTLLENFNPDAPATNVPPPETSGQLQPEAPETSQ
ncbi:MAG TPA: hypothetical protein VGN79_15445 [Devosia sp.]|jgi:hypothetical protein|nr:hypothetical protein [Devosia sp.]